MNLRDLGLLICGVRVFINIDDLSDWLLGLLFEFLILDYLSNFVSIDKSLGLSIGSIVHLIK